MKGFNPNCPEVYGNPGSVRGKTFIVPKGTSAHYMLSRWLHVLGLNERDVNIVDMQPSEAMKAFADGQGDAIALWAPQTFEAEKLGLKTVAHSSDCNARQPILLVANMDYANKHKGDIVAFLRVYLLQRGHDEEDPRRGPCRRLHAFLQCVDRQDHDP